MVLADGLRIRRLQPLPIPLPLHHMRPSSLSTTTNDTRCGVVVPPNGRIHLQQQRQHTVNPQLGPVSPQLHALPRHQLLCDQRAHMGVPTPATTHRHNALQQQRVTAVLIAAHPCHTEPNCVWEPGPNPGCSLHDLHHVCLQLRDGMPVTVPHRHRIRDTGLQQGHVRKPHQRRGHLVRATRSKLPFMRR